MGPSAAMMDAPEQAAPDPDGETPHAFLRRVTRPWHDGVEAAFERFDLRDRQGLSGFLLAQARAVFPLEQALDAAGATALLPDWPARRRAAALRADLAALGLPAPIAPSGPFLPSRDHALGALYVLEGSRLGGRVLHRRVMNSSDVTVRSATGFLAHQVERGWPTFLAVLDGVPSTPAAKRGLQAGADLAFNLFRLAADGAEAPGLPEASTRSGLYRHAHA
ncbi:biliverdin-producing heme oxygenase [Lichenihabitans sp. Uapishka_5]|uniref:biliverdin-producing heme oxygenase n=1 Tax=Lichenihabitans sp. Uapishka_5 TaxID=3037302 RepID=UPI0029E7EEEF|nr:biliverdin-producing heme oxygenase [Lichenihabitans sp. Uapishka_5]MDX7950878.1 biliverdin-producing heme oxygenase [Lichenihabitans sp. Uapishka_5]